jgi:ribosome maturation factor RimP
MDCKSGEAFVQHVASTVGKHTTFQISCRGGECPAFLLPTMTHPVIAPVIELAAPIASELGLEVVAAVFQTNQSPPVLRVDVRNLQQNTGLDDCERMSRALEPVLDQSELLPDAYVLEVSSPGISRVLESDREFISFKGFPITVMTSAPLDGQVTLSGNLVNRDEATLFLNRKGRVIPIPRAIVTRVQLNESKFRD